MKKLSTAFAACLLAGFVSAQVESQNIVGYQSFDNLAASGVYMIGNQFALVGGGSTLVPIASLTNGVLKAGTLSGQADQIQTWDPTTKTYVLYFYKTAIGWVKSTASGVQTTDTVDLKNGVFFRKNGAAAGSLTTSGEVYSGASVTNAMAASGVYLFVNPWPVDVAIASLTNGVLKAGTLSGQADQIQTWDPATKLYVLYFYKTTTGWVKSTASGVQTTDVILAGNAFFFRKNGAAAGSLVLNRGAF